MVATSLPINLVIQVKRLAKRIEEGEVEAIPEMWLLIFGEEIDPETPVDEAVARLSAAITKKFMEDVPVEDDYEAMTGDPVVLTDEELEAIAELRHLRVERKDIEDREKVLRNEILQRIGTASRALTADGRPAAIKRTQIRRNVDRKKLEAEYPDVFDDVMSESEVTILDLP